MQENPESMSIRSGIKELLDFEPISSSDVIGADVASAPETFKLGACNLGELLRPLIRHVGIILGVKHHHFGTVDFVSMVPRIVKVA